MASIEIIDSVGIQESHHEDAVLQRIDHAVSSDSVAFTRKLLISADLCLVWLSAVTALAFRFKALALGHDSSFGSTLSRHAGFMLIFSVLVILFANTQDLYIRPWARHRREELSLLAKAVASAALVMISAIFLSGNKTISREVVVLTILLSCCLMALWRTFLHSQAIAGITEKRNVLIVGAGRAGRLLRGYLDKNPQLGYVVKGFLDRRRGEPRNDSAEGEPDPSLLGPIEELGSIVRGHFIDEVLICMPSDRHLIKDVATLAREAGVNVRVIPDLYDNLVNGAPIEYVGQVPTLSLYQQPIPTLQLILKRLVDVAASSLLLIVGLPLFGLATLLIKLDSDGPILYKSLRVGKKGRTFICYKFRTMVKDADLLKPKLDHLNERDGILFKIANDPRITRAGKCLRKFSIDELPQLWNVLKGDMSLVGPRPPVPGEYNQYALAHLRRLDVVPGITGLWQVAARRNPSFANYIALDTQYVNTWNMWLDCKILCKTLVVVLAGTGQ